MSLLSWWRGRRIKLTDGAFWASFYGGENWAGETISPEGAMQLSAWWSCVRLISETVATLPISVYERGNDGRKAAKREHPLYALLHDAPNADQSAVEFWEGIVGSQCIFGNAYARIERGAGRIVALQFIPADVMVVRRENDGSLRYRYTERGKQYDQGEDDIFHVRGFGVGGDVGLSPVTYARQTLGIATALGKSTGATFKSGMRASGFFTTPGTLTAEQREQARKVLVEPYTGSGATAKAGILEAGFGWTPASIPPKDAEMLLSAKFSVEEICRWLRVPPILIGHASEGQTMWGSGVEQIMIAWLTLGLRPYLTRIEQAVKRQLMTPAERLSLYAEFAVEGLLRADSAARAKFYSSMVQNGIYTRNEVRDLENRERSDEEGADALTVQSNLLPIDQLGKEPARPMQPAPGEPMPPQEQRQ